MTDYQVQRLTDIFERFVVVLERLTDDLLDSEEE